MSVEDARDRFLHAVRHHVPACLGDLFDCGDDIGSDNSAALLAWAARWNVDVPWVRARAALTVRVWRDHPVVGLKRIWQMPPVVDFDPARIPPVPPPWEPWVETEGDYRERLDAYIAAIKRAHEDAGQVRPAAKRAVEHFDWLARYQVGGESYGTIARSVPHVQHRQTVQDAVRRAADFIVLPLRAPSRPGRRAG